VVFRAGKTTTLGRLAKYYTDQGLNVGVVTNDQAADLVDTNALRSQGLHVGEVAGPVSAATLMR